MSIEIKFKLLLIYYNSEGSKSDYVNITYLIMCICKPMVKSLIFYTVVTWLDPNVLFTLSVKPLYGYNLALFGLCVQLWVYNWYNVAQETQCYNPYVVYIVIALVPKASHLVFGYLDIYPNVPLTFTLSSTWLHLWLLTACIIIFVTALWYRSRDWWKTILTCYIKYGSYNSFATNSWGALFSIKPFAPYSHLQWHGSHLQHCH